MQSQPTKRPLSFDEFIGQVHLKTILQTAISSAQASDKPLGHCLFTGESGYGKTTLASIVAWEMGTRVKHITAYAITKPSDMVSLLNTLDTHDILFIDEIHRLKSSVEEVLYIAMEDYMIDMLMPDGTHIRLPLRPFTLIGATTKQESLSPPLKNRFIYDGHFLPYTPSEKQEIIKRYLSYEWLHRNNNLDIIKNIADHVSDTPREIGNFCTMLQDFCAVHHTGQQVTESIVQDFLRIYQRLPGGITPLHQQYLSLLETSHGKSLGLKTLSVLLGLNGEAIEQDIEPLLFKLQYIEKTSRGRILTEKYFGIFS